jgi:putative hemolysin
MTDDPIEQTWRPEVKALRAEIERLRAENVGLLADLAGVATERDEALTEVTRLEAELAARSREVIEAARMFYRNFTVLVYWADLGEALERLDAATTLDRP